MDNFSQNIDLYTSHYVLAITVTKENIDNNCQLIVILNIRDSYVTITIKYNKTQ